MFAHAILEKPHYIQKHGLKLYGMLRTKVTGKSNNKNYQGCEALALQAFRPSIDVRENAQKNSLFLSRIIKMFSEKSENRVGLY